VDPSTPAASEGGPRSRAEPRQDPPEIAPIDTDDAHAPPAKPTAFRGAREFINASRTNIALPFSKINLEEPSAELTELAALVLDLIEALEQAAPKNERDELSNLLARAEALLARLR
jgi:hypothetical protein